MGKVYRNGIPPKRFQYKTLLALPDYDWDEAKLIHWLKENCTGSAQYDFVVFQSERIATRTIEATIWFQKKKDAMLFKLSWAA